MTLFWLEPGGRVQAPVPLDGDGWTLGRDVLAALGAGADTTVSRRHARVETVDGRLHIVDLGSRNGTLLNGVRVEGQAALQAGDVVEVGSHRFRLLRDEAEGIPSRRIYAETTVAATRAAAPARLRLVYDLTRLASGSPAPSKVARVVCEALERSLQLQAAVVWLAEASAPVVGDPSVSPFASDLLQRRVLEGQEVLRHPGSGPAAALAVPLAPEPESLGMLLVVAPPDRPLPAADVDFVMATCALAGEALRRARRDRALQGPSAPGEILGDSPVLDAARRAVDLVAPHHDVTVLLVGETGVGKELFARRVHEASGRSGPLVPVNMAAIPAELMESELFGHVRGAFTGADRERVGVFEFAAGGTLFLDELGEMPASLQAKLLRVLEEGRMTRVGDPRPVEVDVRVVAATNVDIAQQIERGEFREDLYYRVAGHEIRIPPLRERPGDVALLANAFLARRRGPVERFGPGALRMLAAYGWPGNVRQLESTVRLAAIHATGDGSTVVRPEHLDERVRRGTESPPATAAEALARAERSVVVQALRAASGNKRAAARSLGWSINTLRDRLARYAIEALEYAAH